MGADFIEFPKLGIHLDVSPVAFPIGNIEVRWYGIVIALGIMIALTLALRQSKHFNIKEDDLLDMFLWALPVSIIFARLFFVIFTWDQYKNNLIEIVRIWHGGLAIYGAIIGAVLTAYFFTRARKINTLDLCDFAVVYLPLAQAIGRWGNFFNQELYGSNTDLPWGMTGNRIQAYPDPGVDGSLLVHPTFLYESLMNLVVFFILLRIRKNRKVRGSVLASYLMFYSLVRFLLEFLRVDEFGTENVRYNQVFAALVFIGALIWIILLFRRSQKEEPVDEVLAPSPYADVLESLNEAHETDNLEDKTESKETDETESVSQTSQPEPENPSEAPDNSTEGTLKTSEESENHNEETDSITVDEQ